MACPFSRDFSKASCVEEGRREDNARPRIARLRRDDCGKSRQSSFEVTSLLMREENEDEDTQTLNLKHLRAAVLMLTNPSNEAIAVALRARLSESEEPFRIMRSLEKLLLYPTYDVLDPKENYNLLEDIYETLSYHSGLIDQ